MLSNQEKVLEFKKSIERELRGQITQIDSEIEQYQSAQTQAIEEEIQADCHRTIEKQAAKLKMEITSERSHALSELKKGLLLRRDEYVGSIFDAVRQELLTFAASEDYPAFLCEKLRKAGGKYSLAHPIVYVREEDLALRDALLKALPGCTLRASAEISIGGFIIEDEGKPYIINESLDNTLEEQKEWFYSNSGLRITQF